MKKSIIYLGLAVFVFGNAAAASASEKNPIEKIAVTPIKTVSPFCQAIAKGDVETVKKMIEFGSDINSSSNGMTPLMYAARYNRVEIVELLLANGAKINAKDEKGFTALKYAELSNAAEAIQILKAYKKS